MNSITRNLIISAAKNRGLNISFIGNKNKYLKLEDPITGISDIFYGSRPLSSSRNGAGITLNKADTLDFVQSLGYQVHPYLLTTDVESANKFLAANTTIVVKPADGSKSMGVTLNVSDEQKLHNAINYAKNFSLAKEVILQKQLTGNLYRLFVLNGKLIAASHRTAPYVTGDGELTVKELIKNANKSPLRGTNIDAIQGTIDTEEAINYLGVDIYDSILEKGAKLRCLEIESVSAGGDSKDVTSSVHDSIKKIFEHIASELKLFVAGFDIIKDSIETPIDHSAPLPLLEINSCPGLKIHHFPTAGPSSVDIAGMILDEIFVKNTVEK